MLGGKSILTQSTVFCSRNRRTWVRQKTQKIMAKWCRLHCYSSGLTKSFYITEHVEVIFIVSLMCHFSQSTFFPVRVSINSLSAKKPFIIIMNLWTLWMSAAECLKRQHTININAYFWMFTSLCKNLRINTTVCFGKMTLDAGLCEIIDEQIWQETILIDGF